MSVDSNGNMTALDLTAYGIPSLSILTAVTMQSVGVPLCRVAAGERQDRAARGSRVDGPGEPPSVPVPAAIVNAVFDATGVRIRTAPMTPGRVRAVLA